VISEISIPQQEAEEDYFRIPPDSMIEFTNHLRRRRLVLLAQVHSHPREAFHSNADDRWAVVRHEGALSIVVPEFASKTTVRNFEKDTAVFRLTSDDRWQKIELTELSTFLSVT
jgi:proteasome lid subunit RPN8/RPN11